MTYTPVDPYKLAVPRSFQLSLSFWLSHIARYAPSPARPNPTEICDPSVNKYWGKGSNKGQISPKMFCSPQSVNSLLPTFADCTTGTAILRRGVMLR